MKKILKETPKILYSLEGQSPTNRAYFNGEILKELNLSLALLKERDCKFYAFVFKKRPTYSCVRLIVI